jgi:hypothetical protein
MSTALLTKSWLPFAHRPASIFAGWRQRFEHYPFPRLVVHFLARLVRAGDDTASTEFELGAGGLLGLLAAPGAFASLLLLDKYFNSSLLDWLLHRKHQDIYILSAPDKYLFVSLAMAITGIVTVLKWDRIVPDAQDYLNLAPLPVRPRAVFAANAAAIAIAVLVLSVDVNGVSAVLFPFFVVSAAEPTLAAYFQFVAVHAACMILASIFTFCAVFALMGTLSALLPRALFRAVSAWVRGAVLVAFLVLLAGAYAGPAAVARATGARGIQLMPSFWFLGLYQSWQHRYTAALAPATAMAVPATAAAFVLMLLGYALSYRRRFAEVLDSGQQPSRQQLRQLSLRFLDLFALPFQGFPRAGHQFAVRAMLRNEAHRVCLAVSIALGWLAALRDISQGGDAGVVRAPFAAAYLLILGVRVAFEIPAGVPAGWVFRAVLDPRENESRGMARQIILGFLAPFVLAPCFAVSAWKWNWSLAALATACVLAFSLCLMEVLLAGYRKIPLTCPLPGFRDHFLLLVLVHVLGFELFTWAGSALCRIILASPLLFLLVPASLYGAWFWNQLRLKEAREAGELEPGLTFENLRRPEVERLNLLD